MTSQGRLSALAYNRYIYTFFQGNYYNQSTSYLGPVGCLGWSVSWAGSPSMLSQHG